MQHPTPATLGSSHHCPTCAAAVEPHSAATPEDSLCPRCALLLKQFRFSLALRSGGHAPSFMLSTPWREIARDSVAVVETVLELEDQLGFAVPDEEILELSTVGDVLQYFAKLRRPGG